MDRFVIARHEDSVAVNLARDCRPDANQDE